jgi:hypothetical protein
VCINDRIIIYAFFLSIYNDDDNYHLLRPTLVYHTLRKLIIDSLIHLNLFFFMITRLKINFSNVLSFS